MRLLANWLTNIILVLVVLIFLALLIGPSFFHSRMAVVLSGSMEPALPQGALAFTVEVDPATVKVGDVISFAISQYPDVTTSHRVVDIMTIEGKGLYFRTQGDANENPDLYLVPTDSVKGKVIYHIPRLGNIVNLSLDYVRSWAGLATLVGLPSLIIVGTTVIGLGRRQSLRQKHLELLKKRRRQWKAFSR